MGEKTRSNEPGPGQYPIQNSEGITFSGRHVNSKIKNLPNFNFGFSVGEKVSSIQIQGRKFAERSPDPGRYYDGMELGR